MSRYVKAIVAIVGAVVIAVQAAVLGDGAISNEEWGVILTAFLTAVGVYLFKNEP